MTNVDAFIGLSDRGELFPTVIGFCDYLQHIGHVEQGELFEKKLFVVALKDIPALAPRVSNFETRYILLRPGEDQGYTPSEYFRCSCTHIVLPTGEPRRYWAPFQGPLLLVQLPLLAVGCFIAVRDPKRSSLGWKLLGWSLLAPLPAALTTQEVPSLIRAFPLVVPLTALTALGSAWVWERFKHPGLMVAWQGGCLLVLLFNVSYFVHQYAVQQAQYHAWNRDVADERMAQWIAENTTSEPIEVTGKLGPQYPYLLWSGALPWEEYLPVAGQRGEQHWQAGRFRFGDDACPPQSGDPQALYVVDVRCDLPPGYHSIQQIRFADNVAEIDIRRFDPAATASALIAP